jgi:hypothetical protein
LTSVDDDAESLPPQAATPIASVATRASRMACSDRVTVGRA